MPTSNADKQDKVVDTTVEVVTGVPEEDGNDAAASPRTLAAGLSGQKRKEPEIKKKPGFKVVAHLVMAMRRFQASLNPTYTFGKQTSSGSHSARATVTDDGEAPVSSDAKFTRRTSYTSHGHKASFLLRQIPPLEDEEQEA